MGLEEMEQRAGLSKSSSKEGNQTLQKIALVIFGLVFIAGVLVYLLVLRPKWDDHQMKTQNGESRGSVITAGVVVLFDHVSVSRDVKDTITDQDVEEVTDRTRVTLVDPATGGQRAQQLLNGAGACERATDDLMWCDFDARLRLYDAKFAVVAEVEAIVTGAGLAKVLHGKMPHDTNPIGVVQNASAQLLLEDGRIAIVDAVTKTAKASDAVPMGLSPSSAGLHLGNTGSCERSVMFGATRAKVAHSKDTYLAPTRLGVEKAIVFVHHSSLEKANDKLQLTKLDTKGAAAWTTEIGAGACEQGVVIGERVIVTTANSQKRAVAYDLATGKQVWTFAF